MTEFVLLVAFPFDAFMSTSPRMSNLLMIRPSFHIPEFVASFCNYLITVSYVSRPDRILSGPTRGGIALKKVFVQSIKAHMFRLGSSSNYWDGNE